LLYAAACPVRSVAGMSRRLISSTRLLAALVLVAALTPLAPQPAAASGARAPMAAPSPRPAAASSPRPAPATSGAAASAPGTRHRVTLTLTPRATDPTKVRLVRRAAHNTVGAAGTDLLSGPESDSLVCTATVDYQVSGLGEDDFIEETVHVDYQAELDCNFYLDSIDAEAFVLDRSPDFNGQSFDGTVLGTGNEDSRTIDFTANSSGSIKVKAHKYNGGRSVEPAFETILLAPEGVIWADCQPIPGLRYLACDGVGTDQLDVVVGTGPVATGLTRACRDQAATLTDAEENRLDVAFGSAPASTQILRLSSTIIQQVRDFKRDLCSTTTPASFALQRGRQLWSAAVQAAQAGEANGDDRPLYWARLQMTRALDQLRPSPDPAVKSILDQASRGMDDDIPATSPRRVFISGFDPFSLDDDIRNGNPSGAIALALDRRTGLTTSDGTPVEIHAVIFPVRYADFDGGRVEAVFSRHLTDALVASVSLNPNDPSRFHLEGFNGINRGGSPDNQNVSEGGACCTIGSQFTASTLPFAAMVAVDPAGIFVDRHVVEIVNGVRQTSPNGPTPGSTAVEGSGGSFLSNEIAYRVTNYRDRTGHTTLPAGHIHTPNLGLPGAGGVTDGSFDSRRNAIVSRFQTLLLAGVSAVPPAQ